MITVYTTPACFVCKKTHAKLTEAGIEHQVVDISTDAGARAYVVEELGATEAPVVVDDTEPEAWWSGPDPMALARLIQAHQNQNTTESQE